MATGETLHLSASSAAISPSNPSATDGLALDPLSSVDCRLSLTASFDVTRARARDVNESSGRTVVWGENSPETVLVSYRKSQSEVRSHTDTPVAELASLALPYIRVRLADDDILYRMANHFQLGRLREPTRVRFQSAINLARHALTTSGPRI